MNHEEGTYSFRNVDNYQPTLRNVSENREDLLLGGGRLESRKSRNVWWVNTEMSATVGYLMTLSVAWPNLWRLKWTHVLFNQSSKRMGSENEYVA